MSKSPSKQILVKIVEDELEQSSGANPLENVSKPSSQGLNKDCLDYIHQTSPLISSSLSFLFDIEKRSQFFQLLTSEQSSPARRASVFTIVRGRNVSQAPTLSNVENSLNRFIQLYVPLKHMKHLSMEMKLNMITQFLLTNRRTDEAKIELIIDLANHYAEKQEWHLVMQLLDSCTQV